MIDYSELGSKLRDRTWRLNNLYYIKDINAVKTLFKPNRVQKQFMREMHSKNIILKARQLGMTTFIQIYMLDACLFNDNYNCGVIAHNRDDASKFFKDKIKFAYDNLPDFIKQIRSATQDSASDLAFSNGSSIRVGTSLRSGTYQYLHVSEYGKLCAQFPDRALEVKTGALNTVHKKGRVFIESTAEGDSGDFYDMYQTFKDFSSHSAMDYKCHFYPWHEEPSYILDDSVDIDDNLKEYFSSLDIPLTDQQKNWYAAKKRIQKNKMQQEFPSTPDEAFAQIGEYCVYGEEIGEVLNDGRLLDLPKTQKVVDLFVDIGASEKHETTSVWFMQDNEPWHDFVDYYQCALKSISEMVNDIRDKGWNIGRWYVPHDSTRRDHSMMTFQDRLVNAGVPLSSIVTVPRIDRVRTGIDAMRTKFAKCRFDKTRTELGFKALKAYRYDWDVKMGVLGAPRHDWASHPSDAIRQYAQAYRPVGNETFTQTVTASGFSVY